MKTPPTTKDYQKDLDSIINTVRNYYPTFKQYDKEKITEAFWLSHAKHRDQKRLSGEPYFTHPIAATKILFSIKPDIETIIACLLHDVIEDTDTKGDEIQEKFNKNVRILCEGIEKISKVQLKENKQFENIQKIFLAMAQDIRVIFIKLADRIHNLSTLESLPPAKQKRIARESLEIYAPVAGKLGLFEFKTQIEDLAFKHISPKEHQEISKEMIRLNTTQTDLVEKAKTEIEKALKQTKTNFIEIHGRPKNLYSIYLKMKRKNFNSVSEIFDLFALRIITQEIQDCYTILGLLHSHWHPLTNRFKDYIANPKPNGYQSLHTTILGFGKIPLEIQIKTQKMHLDAEHGPASHWAYKKSKHSNFDKEYLERMNWFPEDLPIEVKKNPKKFYERITNSILKDRVYVFTPKGEIKSLPAKSTPVDFAFEIHSDIGAHCIGAKINGIIKPLNYELQKGDVVEILKQKGKTPNPAWLNFVKSTKAINGIRALTNTPLLQKQKDKSPETKDQKPTNKKFKLLDFIFNPKKKQTKIIIGGQRHIPFHIANCCSPKIGTSIVAYKTRGIEVSIHDINCQELKKLDPKRILESHFLAEKTLILTAKDRIGLLRDVSKAIAKQSINILESNLKFNKDNITVSWTFKIEYTSNAEYKNITKIIKQIPEVITLTER